LRWCHTGDRPRMFMSQVANEPVWSIGGPQVVPGRDGRGGQDLSHPDDGFGLGALAVSLQALAPRQVVSRERSPQNSAGGSVRTFVSLARRPGTLGCLLNRRWEGPVLDGVGRLKATRSAVSGAWREAEQIGLVVGEVGWAGVRRSDPGGGGDLPHCRFDLARVTLQRGMASIPSSRTFPRGGVGRCLGLEQGLRSDADRVDRNESLLQPQGLGGRADGAQDCRRCDHRPIGR
jgi:hypothetical protein